MPRKTTGQQKKNERKAGTGAETKKKTKAAPRVGERQSLRLKERAAGAGLALGLVAGGVGGWAIGRSMSASDVRRARYLEARNRQLEEELARRG